VSILRPARQVLTEQQEVLPSCQVMLGDTRVWSNAARVGGPALARTLHWVNATRHALQPSVVLGRYPAGALLTGAAPFHLLAGGVLVREQSFTPDAELPAVAAALAARGGHALAVDRPCLLACHPGSWTWGHWLLESLPKIVLAERAMPKLFAFAVPAEIVADIRHPYNRAVLESLAAYGITPDRLLRIKVDVTYRFSALFDVAGVLERGGDPHVPRPHPAALAVMRDAVRLAPPGKTVAVTAMLRQPSDTRPLLNRDAVTAALRAAGAVVLAPGITSFADQVAAFRASRVVVGDLGSNLAGLVYAARGSGVLTLASTAWQDSYFIGVERMAGTMRADLRGAALPGTPPDASRDGFVIDPAEIPVALAALADAQGDDTTPARLIDGAMVAEATGPALRTLACGRDGNAGGLLTSGFSPPEQLGSWALAPLARIELPRFMPPGTPLWLELDGYGFLARPHFISRPMEIRVNGYAVGTWEIDGQTHLNAWVPAEVLGRQRGVVIEFASPICVSPRDFGVSGDARMLMFFLRSLALRRPAA